MVAVPILNLSIVLEQMWRENGFEQNCPSSAKSIYYFLQLRGIQVPHAARLTHWKGSGLGGEQIVGVYQRWLRGLRGGGT